MFATIPACLLHAGNGLLFLPMPPVDITAALVPLWVLLFGSAAWFAFMACLAPRMRRRVGHLRLAARLRESPAGGTP